MAPPLFTTAIKAGNLNQVPPSTRIRAAHLDFRAEVDTFVMAPGAIRKVRVRNAFWSMIIELSSRFQIGFK